MKPSDFPIVEGRYRFACTRCGECCFDQRVYLEPRDVFHLGEPAALFAGGVIGLEEDAGIWRCRLLFLRWGKGDMCRFLAPEMQDDQVRAFRCQLHGSEQKPLVCTLSPLARAKGETVFRLVPPVDGCPGMGKGAPRAVEHSERMAWSVWYQRELAPRIEASEQLTRRAFHFRVSSVAELNAHLLAL